MIYSVLEQHIDGSWWFHIGASSNTIEAAEKWATDRPWMLETRPMCIVKHLFPFPQKTLFSYSLDGFYEIGNDRTPYTWMDCKMVKMLNHYEFSETLKECLNIHT